MHSGNRIAIMLAGGVMFVLAALQAAAPAVAQEQAPTTESKLEVGPTWKFKTDPSNVGVKENWSVPGTDDKDWVSIRGDRPGWNAQGFPRYNGYGWYRTRVKVPKDLDSRKNLLLVFGAVDEDAVVYINGKKAFEHTCESTGVIPAEIWDTPFVLKARQYLKLGEENLIAVRVYNRVAMGGLWKPVYLISTDAEEPTSVYQKGLIRTRFRKYLVPEDQILKPRREKAFAVTLGERQLFLDDVGIAKAEHLTRTMHRPAKKGAVIRSADPGQTIQTRTAPIWDPREKLFKFWVLSVDEPYRTSRDGLHWTAGPKMNMGISMVVRDPHDPDPSRRFKAFFPNQVSMAVSPDAVTWTKTDAAPVPSSDEWNFSFDEKEHLFIATVKQSGPYGRAVWLSVSRDFKHWSRPKLIFHADAKDQEIGRRRIKERLADPTLKQTEYDVPSTYSIQVYNMGVFRYESMYIGLPSMYHHTGKVPPSWPGFKKMHLSPEIRDAVSKYGDYTGFYNIQLACSRTMMLDSWKRLGDRRPFIKTSRLGAGAYDTQTIIGPSNAVVRGDELWFYYTGIREYAFISSGGKPGYDDYYPDAGAICLAVLRRDGFVSLDAGDADGTVLTMPFTLTGGELFVNVDAPKGELCVEVLNRSDKVVAASAPMKGDLLRGQVKWRTGGIGGLKGKEVSLRFRLRGARLYSYWLK